MKIQKEEPLTHYGLIRRLPVALNGRRMYHDGMYTIGNFSKVRHRLIRSMVHEPGCVFDAFQPEQLLQYARR
eukprot:2826449-Pleurochrysis_carterae.AAC.1